MVGNGSGGGGHSGGLVVVQLCPGCFRVPGWWIRDGSLLSGGQNRAAGHVWDVMGSNWPLDGCSGVFGLVGTMGYVVTIVL